MVDFLGVNWDKIGQELSTDLSNVIGKIRGTGTDPLSRVPVGGGGGPLDRVRIGGNADPLARVNLTGYGDPLGRVSLGGYSDPFSKLPTSTHDDPFWRMEPSMKPRGYTPPVAPTSAAQGGTTSTAANAMGMGSSAYANMLNEEATKYGDAPDLAEVAQAVMELESGGRADAQGVVVTQGPYAGQRAQGLMQIMPGNYPGANLMDPRTNVQKGLEMLYQRYKQYGDWDKAVASYFGAIDSNGNITGSQDDNGTSGYAYVATVNQHRAKIRSTRAAASGSGTTPPQMSSIWGNAPGSVMQGYAVVSPGVNQNIYAYGREYGLAAGHTGIDIGLKRGTQLYMPTGLTGVVEIAGGSGVFRDEDGGDPGNVPGRGELRIRLSNGDVMILGHNSAINVKVGQQVSGGQLLGLSGSAAGEHLHLEVRQRNAQGGYTLVNPLNYFARPPAAGGGNLTP